MSKVYYVSFGTGDPRQFTGLAPTFLTFNNNGTGVAAPAIAEVTGATGFYAFTWGTTTPIVFLVDAATTSPGVSGRYVKGSIDPADRADEYGTTMIAIGTSLIAQGVTLKGYGVTNIALGTTAVAFGSTNLGVGFTNFGFGVSIYAGLGFQGTSILALGSTVIGIGNTVSAIGVSAGALAALVGNTSSSFGSTSVDPSTVFGFLIRNQELNEGNQVYTKATGVFDLYSRGSSTLLREKTISDTSTTTIKT